MTMPRTIISLFACLVALAIFGSIAHFAAAGGAGTGTQWVGNPYQNTSLGTYQPTTSVSGNATWSTTLSDISLAYAWNRWTLVQNKPSCFTGQTGNFSSDTMSPDCVSGFVTAGEDVNVTITHEARVYDATSGAVISNNAVLTPGQTVRLEFKKLVPENIYWFGTGYSLDSPYGEWRANAAPPPRVNSNNGGNTANHVTCNIRDYTNSISIDDYSRYEGCMKYGMDHALPTPPQCRVTGTDGSGNSICEEYWYNFGSGNITEAQADSYCMANYPPQTNYRFDVYVPLEIAPPTRTFSYGGLTGCTAAPADSDSDQAVVCTVPNTPAATLTPTFNYGATYGYFYYRYWDTRNMNYGYNPSQYQYNYGASGCYGNNIPLYKIRDNVVNDPSYNPVDRNGLHYGDVESSPFRLDVPAMSVPFTFTVAPVGSPPTAPTIAGPTSGAPSTNYTFSFTSTDPDGDTLRYGIDWDNDGTLDQWVPAAGYVTSGTSQNSQKQWATEGAKTFHALAQDANNNSSGWSSHTITIAQTPSLSCTVNGGSSPIGVSAGTAVTYQAVPTGGTGAPYSWTDNPDQGTNLGNTATVNVTYSSPGGKAMQVAGSGGTTGFCPLVTVTGGSCPAPNTVDLTASPDRVREGQTTTLTLSGTGIVDSCTVTGPGVNQTVAASSCSLPTTQIPTGAITTQTTFTVSCDSGAVTDTAIVNVIPTFEEF